MSDPEISNQPLLAAPNQQAVIATQSGRSSRAYKVAGITLLACVLIVGQAMITYFLLSQRNDIRSLKEQNDNLQAGLTKGRSVVVPLRMHMNALPMLMDVSVDEEAPTEDPTEEKKVPLRASGHRQQPAARIPPAGTRFLDA